MSLPNPAPSRSKGSQRSPLDSLTRLVGTSLRSIGITSVPKDIVGEILSCAYAASLRTEEGRLIRCAITFADPEKPDSETPPTRRPMHPSFTAFSSPLPFNSERVVKLSRAIDPWAGSLTVYGTSPSDPKIWGVADQRVHFNLMLNAEPGKFSQPGLFCVVVDGIGQLAVYSDLYFLGGLRYEEVYSSQPEVLRHEIVLNKITPVFAQMISHIASHLSGEIDHAEIEHELTEAWIDSVRRLCIGILRAGTGGTIILSSALNYKAIQGGHIFNYARLRHAIISRILVIIS